MRKRFILSVLSLPAFGLLLLVTMLIIAAVQLNPTPVGMVDLSGTLKDLQDLRNANYDPVLFKLQLFSNEQSARQALYEGEIQAYFVVSAGYRQSGQVRMVALKLPGDNVEPGFREYLRQNLLQGQPSEVIQRLEQGDRIEARSLDGQKQIGQRDWPQFIFPLASGMIFIFVISMSSGYLLQAVQEEKENRTIEMLVTSVSSNQLVIGKVAGNLCVGLTQLFLWLFFPGFAVWIADRLAILPSDLTIQPQILWLIPATLFPAFILVAGLMAMVGAIAIESHESEQVMIAFLVPLMAIYFLLQTIMTHPDGTLAIALSLFPYTAPVILPIRVAFDGVPGWQIALSLVLLYLCAAGALWLAGRAFRLGLLRYGKRLSWRQLFGRG